MGGIQTAHCWEARERVLRLMLSNQRIGGKYIHACNHFHWRFRRTETTQLLPVVYAVAFLFQNGSYCSAKKSCRAAAPRMRVIWIKQGNSTRRAECCTEKGRPWQLHFKWEMNSTHHHIKGLPQSAWNTILPEEISSFKQCTQAGQISLLCRRIYFAATPPTSVCNKNRDGNSRRRTASENDQKIVRNCQIISSWQPHPTSNNRKSATKIWTTAPQKRNG